MNECKINAGIETFFINNGDILKFGVLLAIIWTLAYFLSWAGGWIWNWMDDKSAPRHNPLLKRVAPIFGYRANSSGGRYSHKGDGYAEGFLLFFYPFCIALLSPLLIIFYEITLFVATTFGLAHLGRFVFRGKKLLTKHIEDKNIHGRSE